MKKNGRFKDAFGFILMMIVAVILWAFIVWVFQIKPYILPGPIAVIKTLLSSWKAIAPNLLVTINEIIIGYILTVIISIPCATLISYSRAFERTVYPLLLLLQLIPKVAIAPLFIIWFGFGIYPKIFMVFLLSFFPLLIDSVVGFKSLNPRLIYVAKSMTDSEWDFFWKIRLPNALPNIFSGLKVSIAFATVGAIVGEFVGSDKGLGYLLLRANGDLNTQLLFAVLLVLSIVGIILYEMIELLEKIAIPWHVTKRQKLSGGDNATL